MKISYYTCYSYLLQQPLARTALVICLLQQSSQLAIQQQELQENSTRSPRCIDPLYILQAPGPCYNNNYLPLYPCIVLMSYYSSTCVFLKTTMLSTCTLTSYSLISITMCAPCVHHEEPLSLDIIPNPNSFQTLPNPSRP